MFFDTHLHLIYPDKLRYPWLADVPALNMPSTFDSYLRQARRLGISNCLHMEVDVDPNQIVAETDLIANLMATSDMAPDMILSGAISACRPEQADFADFLDWADENHTIKGLRRALHTMPDALSQSLEFRNNIKRLSGTSLTFDLCVRADQLPLAAALADHCPDVSFILDHCGVPDIKAGAYKPWATDLSKLAQRPNVTAKISGIIAYADADNWRLDDLRPYFDHTVSAFGHDRILWGSDSPVCRLGGGLETWVAATHALTSGWSLGQKCSFYSDNAYGIWGR